MEDDQGKDNDPEEQAAFQEGLRLGLAFLAAGVRDDDDAFDVLFESVVGRGEAPLALRGLTSIATEMTRQFALAKNADPAFIVEQLGRGLAG